MKKITMFLAALAVVFSANAQDVWYDNPAGDWGSYSYWYDMNTNTWVTDRMPEFDEVFTFAFSISNPIFVDYLSSAPDCADCERAVGMTSWGTGTGSANRDLRLRHITGTIYGADMVGSQLYGGTTTLRPDEDGIYRVYFEAWPAQFGSGTPWWAESREDEPYFGYGGTHDLPLEFAPATGANTGPELPAGSAISTRPGVAEPGAFTVTSVSDIAADDECGEPTGFYNLLGQSLGKNAPATGVFIATYADCAPKKFVVVE